MDISGLLPYIANGSIAIVVVILILSGTLVPGWMYKDLKKENAELKRINTAERARGDTAVETARTTRDVLLSLRGRLRDRGGDDDLE